MPATVEEIEIKFGTNADATARAVKNLRDRVEEAKKVSSKKGNMDTGESAQIDKLKAKLSELKSAKSDAFRTKLSTNSSWTDVDNADNKISRINESIASTRAEIRKLRFRDLADDMVDTSTKADILRNKIEGLSEKLASGLSTGKMDDAQIGRTVEQIQKFKAALEEIERDASDTSGGIRNIKKEVESSGKSADRASNGFSKFGNTLKRLIIYRALRSIIYGIANAAKDGYKNLIQYSNGIRSADSAQAAATANAYATSLNQVKNSAAAAAAPIIQSLLPAIQTGAGWFIAAANAVNMFISALQGKSSYTRALGVAADYAGGLEDNLSGAGSAAKELKRTLLSFDEINALDDLYGGGGSGGGGGGGGASASDMFEEVQIEGWAADAANKIKDIWASFGEVVDNVSESIRKTKDNYEVCMAIINDNARILKEQKNMWAEYFKTIGQYEKAKKLGEIIFELSDKASSGMYLTNSEMKLLRDSIEEINGMKLDGIYLEIDEMGRVTNMTRSEFESLIETQLNLYKVKAAQDMLIETYKRQYEATQNMRVAWDAYEAATERANAAQERWNVVSTGSDNQFHSMKEQWEAWAEKNAAEQALRDCEAAVNDSIETVNTLNYDVSLLEETVKSAAIETNKFGTSGVDSYKKIQDEAMSTAGAYDTFQKEAKKHLDEYKKNLDNANRSAEDSKSSISKSMNGIGSSIETLTGKVTTLGNKLKNLSDVNVSVHYSSTGTAHGGTSGYFAEGGFPKAGSFFWAGENNVPELMGTIGGRTAVASGREITGITAAVNESSAREAMLLNMLIAAVNGLADSNSGGGGITTTELMGAMKRQNRRDGATTFAV